MPVFCQPEDEDRLSGLGAPTRARWWTRLDWDGLRIARTGGRHGADEEVARALAPVSGFVLGRLYIAGDTVWCREVEEALEHVTAPAVAVVNASGARYRVGRSS